MPLGRCNRLPCVDLVSDWNTASAESSERQYSLWGHHVHEWKTVYAFTTTADRVGLDAPLSDIAHRYDKKLCSGRHEPFACI